MSAERLAILADIHGNYHALKAVLADIARQRVDAIIVNGDHVNRNPDNLRVMETLAHSDARLLQGNHDDLVRLWRDHDASLPAAWFGDAFWDGLRWVVEQLESENWIDTLAAMPQIYRHQVPGAPDVLISHGSPRHYREGYGRFMEEHIFAEIAERHPAGVYVGSHTHRPLLSQWGNRLVLNTGAVGTPFNGDPRAQYLILTLREQGWVPEFRAVPYPREEALARFDSSGFSQAAGVAGRIFQEELHLAIGLYGRFFSITEKERLERTFASYETIKARYLEHIGDGWTAMPEQAGVPHTIDTLAKVRE